MIIHDYILYYKKNKSNKNNGTWNKRLWCHAVITQSRAAMKKLHLMVFGRTLIYYDLIYFKRGHSTYLLSFIEIGKGITFLVR